MGTRHFECRTFDLSDNSPYTSSVIPAPEECKKNTQERYEIVKSEPGKALCGGHFQRTKRPELPKISSLLCNCDGGVHFGVVSVSPVPAESRLKSGFFARKALRDELFWKWVQIGIFPDFGEKCGKIGEKNRETAIHRRIELPTDENLFLRCYKWMYSPLTGTAFPR